MLMGGNMLAIGVVLAWPVLSLVLFLTMSAQRAVLITLIGGAMLVPPGVGFDFPAIPPLDKNSIPNLVALLLTLALARPGEFRWIKSLPVNLLMLGCLLSPLFTWITNREVITIGSMVLPGMTWYDAVSGVVERGIMLTPFVVGAGLLRREGGHRDTLIVLVAAGLLYAPFIVMEVFKGPFLAARIFGVDPGGYWIQQIRGSGFRAMVFMEHGLIVSFYLGLSVLAAVALWRLRLKVLSLPGLLCLAILFAVLILNKSLGALVLVVLLAPLIRFLSPRRIVGVTMVFGLIIITYPVLRASGLIPVTSVVSAANLYSEDRGGSLEFRLRNEDMLLDRANQKPLFGWGGYNRNKTFVVTDWGATLNESVTDGTWIIFLGQYGWLGYLSSFGLLSYPFFHLFRMRRNAVPLATAALAVVLLFNLIDLIPNSSLRPISWLMAGALAGFAIPRPARSGSDGRATPVASS